MKCSFCNKPMKAGTGKMFVKNDGTIYYWCSRRCEVKFAETAKGRR